MKWYAKSPSRNLKTPDSYLVIDKIHIFSKLFHVLFWDQSFTAGTWITYYSSLS